MQKPNTLMEFRSRPESYLAPHGAELGELADAYPRLLALAHQRLMRERRTATYDTQELTQDTCEKLARQRAPISGGDRILAMARLLMARILIDRARSKHRLKRDAGVAPGSYEAAEEAPAILPSAYETVAIATALAQLRALDERQSIVVEMRVLAGMKAEQIAEVLGVARRTVDRDWIHAQCWLRRSLGRLDPR